MKKQTYFIKEIQPTPTTENTLFKDGDGATSFDRDLDLAT